MALPAPLLRATSSTRGRPPSPTRPALHADTLCTTYVVQSGDSLWSISNKFGVLQDDLVAALESCLSGWTSSTALQVGQKIKGTLVFEKAGPVDIIYNVEENAGAAVSG